MLTVDFRQLGMRPGDLVLDMGCGGGRHAFEAARRGARVVPFDRNNGDLKETRDTLEAMIDAKEAPAGSAPGAVTGDATSLPFADGSFDRVIAAEVLEHVPDDQAALAELARVLTRGGVMALTVPRWLPERVCWALSDKYHAPAVRGGHLRIYRRSEVVTKLRHAGLFPSGWRHVHALHAPYWWLRCLVGPQRPPEDHALVNLYHRLLVWDLTYRPLITRALEGALNPLIGKSLVVYATKPA